MELSIHELESLWQKSLSEIGTCLYKGCTNRAIKSHVLQKNGILDLISENRHIIQMERPSFYNIKKENIFHFKEIGINNAYTFYGFCNEHDTKIFLPIENYNTIDLYNKTHQALFAYRGLCQELNRKTKVKKWEESILNKLNSYELEFIKPNLDGNVNGITNNLFFKEKLEDFIEGKNDDFIFETIQIPNIDLCISVPLNIGKFDFNPKLTYEENLEYLSSKRFPVGFINLFPYKGRQYAIIGYHKEFECIFSKKLIRKFKYGKRKEKIKEISDLITLRAEFWVMSISLFKSIPKQKIDKYIKIFGENILNHSIDLGTKLNLFEHIK